MSKIKFFNNDEGVSPIVATLVLIVVAIIGAAAVGLIMGSFSSNVSQQASSGDTVGQASTQLSIAGSTTLQPVSELLAKAYMNNYTGVKITVQAGGSGAGVSSTGMDIVDLGSASRPLKTEEKNKWPQLQEHTVGYSAVFIIANPSVTNTAAFDDADLATLYQSATGVPTAGSDLDTAGVDQFYQRADSSGTEETFADFLGLKESNAGASIPGVNSNAEMINKISTTAGAMGFADAGFALNAGTSVKILGVVKDGKTYAFSDFTAANVKASLKDPTNTANKIPSKLTRPLNYLTNGPASVIEQSYINFAMSQPCQSYFTQNGYFSVSEINTF